MLASDALVLAFTCLLAAAVAAIAFFYQQTRSAVVRANSIADAADAMLGLRNGLRCFTFDTGEVFEGEWVDFKRSGFGMQWDKDGTLLHCGHWADNVVDTRPVPRSKIPVGTHLSAAALAAPVERTLLLLKGGHFVGEFNANFQPHGEGTEFAADGTERASGHWRDGLQHGHGWQLKADGNRYEGGFAWGHFVGILKDYADLTFADAFVGGVGKLTQTDGSVYEGDFFMCDRLGLGVQWDKNGNMISCGCLDWNQHHSRPVPRIKIPVGTFLSAAVRAADPSRTLLMPDGGHFVGEFSEKFQPHGFGTRFASDGQVRCEGGWFKGKLHGRGKQVDPGQDVYEGDFQLGTRSGLGRLTWTVSGQVYEGEFKGDELSGLGIKWSRDGRQLMCGRWAGDRLVQQRAVPRRKIPVGLFLSAAARAAPVERTLLMPNGGHFVGDFNAEFKPHGEGTEYRADGSEAASGQWRNSILHGSGTQTLTDGSRFQGEFDNGRYSGLGKFTWPDGSVYIGAFSNNKMDGLGIRWDARGHLSHCGRWNDCELSVSRPVPRSHIVDDSLLSAKAKAAPSDHTLLLPDGGYYVGGCSEDHWQHGNGVTYHANGKAAASGRWSNGRLHGLAVTWDERGKMEECGRFAQGQLTEQRPVPRLRLPANRINNNYGGGDLLLPSGGRYVGQLDDQDRQHGDGVEFTADGSETFSGQWRDGKKHGRGKSCSGDRYKGEFVAGKRSGLGAESKLDGHRFEGEWAEGQRSGLGVEWNKNGKMVKCGRWADDWLRASCPVPRSKIPFGKFVSAAAKDASLLFPDGGFYRGELNAQLQRHGKGSMHAANGRTVSEGVWRADRLLTAAEITALAVAALAPAASAASASSVAPADSSVCVVCQDARPDCHTGCAHICMCMKCAKQVHSCPQCRKTVTKRTKVFIS